MSEKVLFNNSPVGYDKQQVDQYIFDLNSANASLQNALNDYVNKYNQLQNNSINMQNELSQLKQELNNLMDKNKQLEYQYFRLNEQYQQLTVQSNNIASVMVDARNKANEIEAQAIENAKLQANIYKKEILNDLSSHDDVSQNVVQYYKAKRNLLIMQQALLMLQDKIGTTVADLNNIIDDLSQI